MITRIAALVAAAISVGCVSARPSQPTAPQARAPEDRRIYRVDFVVASTDPGKTPTTASYTLNLVEYDDGEVHLGANVPLSTQARQDVGLKIKASVRSLGDDLLLRDTVEMSALDEPANVPVTIRKITTTGDAVLHGGQSALVASLEDPLSHKRYEVSAAATRLR